MFIGRPAGPVGHYSLSKQFIAPQTPPLTAGSTHEAQVVAEFADVRVGDPAGRRRRLGGAAHEPELAAGPFA